MFAVELEVIAPQRQIMQILYLWHGMIAFMLYNYNPDGEVHWSNQSSSIWSILSTDFTLIFNLKTRFATNHNEKDEFLNYFFPSTTPLVEGKYVVQYLIASVVVLYNHQKSKGVMPSLMCDEKINVQGMSHI